MVIKLQNDLMCVNIFVYQTELKIHIYKSFGNDNFVRTRIRDKCQSSYITKGVHSTTDLHLVIATKERAEMTI